MSCASLSKTQNHQPISFAVNYEGSPQRSCGLAISAFSRSFADGQARCAPEQMRSHTLNLRAGTRARFGVRGGCFLKYPRGGF